MYRTSSPVCGTCHTRFRRFSKTALKHLTRVGVIVDDEDYSRATCDQCGISVRARFVIALPSGGIVCYCGSHTKQHWAALNNTGALIVQLGTSQ